MHLACICPAVPGHLNPAIALGRELVRRGHRVTFVNLLDAERAVSAGGLDFYPLGQTEFPAGCLAEQTAILGRLRGRQALTFTLEQLDLFARVIYRELPPIALRSGVEGLIVDQILAAGGTVAEHLKLPFVTLCGALATNYEPAIPPFATSWPYRDRWWARLRNRVGWAVIDKLLQPVAKLDHQQRQDWGLKPYRSADESYSTLAQISQQPVGFDFPRQHLPPHFHYVGPLSDAAARPDIDFPYERLTGQPLIYASLGTLQNQLPAVFRQIIDACDSLPVQLVLSLGRAGSEVRDRLPAGALVVDHAPQLQLLERAALCITHGGLNTTLESLRCGVPLVAIPIANDQPGVAARIVHVGVGELVPLKQLSTERLRQAVQRVMQQASYRQRAQAFQRAIAAHPGPPRAAEIVEQALTSRAAVTS